MKVLLYLVWLCACAATVYSAEKPSMVTWEGKRITGIREVRVNTDGRIVVIHENSGFSTTADKLPEEFLNAWGITEEKRKAAESARSKAADADFDRAVRAGLFREVGGIVYDLRKAQPDWTTFSKVTMLQAVDNGGIVLISKDPQNPVAIFVRNLPRSLADYETVSFTAKLAGSFSFINKLGDERTIRTYDVGRACSRDEVPEALRTGGKLWAAAEGGSRSSGDPLGKLPDGEDLRGMGTGFFITEDGHLITNWHVAREAKRIKVRVQDRVLDAKVVRMDRARDLALIKVEGGPFRALPLSSEPSAALGEEAFTIGFPNVLVQGFQPKYTDGRISSLAGLRDDPAQYQISVPVQPGNSGGPLLDRNGYVVGVVDAKLNELRFLAASGSLPQNVNYAIKARVVREFLEKDPPFSLPAIAATPKADDAVKNAEAAVAMVLVY